MSDVVKIKGSPHDASATKNGVKWKFTAFFEDGTQLEVTAKVPDMPLADMTPREVQTFSPITNEKGEIVAFKDVGMTSDGGVLEMFGLQMQTSAYQILNKIYLELESRRIKDNE